MLLVIDMGNTNGVFALYEGEKLRHIWRLETVRTRLAEEYAAFFTPLCTHAGISVPEIQGVIVGSVVPETEGALRTFCQAVFGVWPLILTKDHIPMAMAVDQPESVGIDRLVNAWAVKVFYRTPALVIDFGTATTFDVIDKGGAFAGGAIAAGCGLCSAALHKAASQVPLVFVEKPAGVIGKNTREALQSGLYWGTIGLVSGLVSRIKAEQGGDELFVLATGGLAGLFIEDLPFVDVFDPELTLKGLLSVYKDMKGTEIL